MIINDAKQQLVRLVARSMLNGKPESFGIWIDRDRTYVDKSSNKPKGLPFTLIGEKWDNNTIQIRSDGAQSEFVKVIS